MKIDRKDESVLVKYENGRISIYNADRSISGVLEISSEELRKMYFGNDGEGLLHLVVITDD